MKKGKAKQSIYYGNDDTIASETLFLDKGARFAFFFSTVSVVAALSFLTKIANKTRVSA